MTDINSTTHPWQCVLCKQKFANQTAFHAHHIFKHTRSERCLDQHELTALDWTRSKRGIWHAGNSAQTRPSQIKRLPTVRQVLEAVALAGLPEPSVAFA